MTTEKQSFFETNRDSMIVAGFVVFVLAIYAQTSGFQYINLDDNLYVYENPVIGSGLNWETIKWAFTSFQTANWHPLTWISLALDVQLFGVSSGIHHVMSVILHLINTVLAFYVFRRMTGRVWASAVVATLFAVHPAHVESVAWVSERKDVLCTTFWFLSIWFYVRWTEGGAKLGSGFYFSALAMFAMGLMAKPMVITLPFVLLLCDVWPLNRVGDGPKKDLWKLIIEKIPFFALSIASGYVTVLAQRSSQAVASLSALPLDIRIKNSILSYVKYILMAFYPNGLAVWYPYERNIGLAELSAAAILLVLVTSLCVWQFSSRRYLLFGWLWFVGTLVPVIGIVQVGGQSMADRYSYIPYFGLFMIVVFGSGELFESFKVDRRIVTAFAVVVITVLAVFAYIQTAYWRDNETLYRQTLAVTKNNFLIEQNYCHALMFADRLDEAEPLCRASLDHRPGYFEALNTLGVIKFKRGDLASAEELFKAALASAKFDPLTYSNLAQTQILQGRPADGEANLQKAVELSGDQVSPAVFANALAKLVDEYIRQGNYEKAFENLTRLRYVQPESVEVRVRLVNVLCKLKRYDAAKAEAQSVLAADPNNAGVWNTLGMILLETGNQHDAVEAFQKAVKLRPDFQEARDNLQRTTK